MEANVSLRALLAAHGFMSTEILMAAAASVRQPYRIRIGLVEDLEALEEVEQICWNELRVSKQTLQRRVANNPGGQWVAVVEGRVVGVMYTQRITSETFASFTDASFVERCTYSTQEDLHLGTGTVLQLLGVSVLPQYAHLQIGEALRNFVVSNAADGNRNGEGAVITEKVVAMTRCSASGDLISEQEYLQYIARHTEGSSDLLTTLDPTLSFHLSAGARIVAPIARYRLTDKANWGYSVLICYQTEAENHVPSAITATNSGDNFDCSSADNKLLEEKSTSSASKSASTSASKEEEIAPVTVTVSFLMGLVGDILQHSSLDAGTFPSTPFMNLGFDSLQIMELRNTLMNQLDMQQLSPVILFDFPTPLLLLSELNRLLRLPFGVATKPPRIVPALERASARRNQSEEVYGICGISCRFPGDALNCEPNTFYQVCVLSKFKSYLNHITSIFIF